MVRDKTPVADLIGRHSLCIYRRDILKRDSDKEKTDTFNLWEERKKNPFTQEPSNRACVLAACVLWALKSTNDLRVEKK